MASHVETEKKPIYKKWWFWVIIVVLIIGVIGATQGGTTNTSTQPENTVQNSPVENTTSASSDNTKNVKVTLAQYNQVKDGMTYDEVVAIFGGKETSSTESEIAGIKSQVMTWSGNGTFSVVSIGFTDGKVSSKSQTGLE